MWSGRILVELMFGKCHILDSILNMTHILYDKNQRKHASGNQTLRIGCCIFLLFLGNCILHILYSSQIYDQLC